VAYIIALPKSEQQAPEWQAATALNPETEAVFLRNRTKGTCSPPI
jgi:hypothetical protein